MRLNYPAIIATLPELERAGLRRQLAETLTSLLPRQAESVDAPVWLLLTAMETLHALVVGRVVAGGAFSSTLEGLASFVTWRSAFEKDKRPFESYEPVRQTKAAAAQKAAALAAAALEEIRKVLAAPDSCAEFFLLVRDSLRRVAKEGGSAEAKPLWLEYRSAASAGLSGSWPSRRRPLPLLPLPQRLPLRTIRWADIQICWERFWRKTRHSCRPTWLSGGSLAQSIERIWTDI